MLSRDSTLSPFAIGPISEEPASYVDASPAWRSRSTLHRLRRATSLSGLDRAMTSTDSTGTLQQSPLAQYRQKSHSSFCLPRERLQYRNFSSLSGTVVLGGETASPEPNNAALDSSQSPEPETLLKPIALAPTHIMHKRYRRTYFQCAIYSSSPAQLVDHLLKPR
jgi:hypothetical protein